MKLWLDAQLSPQIAAWMRGTLGVDAEAVRDLGLRDSTDSEIFEAARGAMAVVMTKDIDFVTLLERLGPPPQVVWLTCGNTSNVRLQELLSRTWPQVVELLAAGEPLVEVSGQSGA